MRHISVKLSESDYQKLMLIKGAKTTSEYIRMIIATNHDSVQSENRDFNKLFLDVAIMREMMSVHSMSAEKMLALAECLTKVASIANQPAYSHHVDEIRGLHRELFAKLKEPL